MSFEIFSPNGETYVPGVRRRFSEILVEFLRVLSFDFWLACFYAPILPPLSFKLNPPKKILKFVQFCTDNMI
jgi:hypothetical protein